MIKEVKENLIAILLFEKRVHIVDIFARRENLKVLIKSQRESVTNGMESLSLQGPKICWNFIFKMKMLRHGTMQI